MWGDSNRSKSPTAPNRTVTALLLLSFSTSHAFLIRLPPPYSTTRAFSSPPLLPSLLTVNCHGAKPLQTANKHVVSANAGVRTGGAELTDRNHYAVWLWSLPFYWDRGAQEHDKQTWRRVLTDAHRKRASVSGDYWCFVQEQMKREGRRHNEVERGRKKET